MSLGDTYENKILDAMYGDGRASNMPATVYIDLYSAAPTDAGGGTVLTSGTSPGYAPVAVANTTVNWPAATSSQKKNGVIVTFPTATGNWVQATHFAIKDANGGAIMNWGALGTPVTVVSGATFVFEPNAIVITAS